MKLITKMITIAGLAAALVSCSDNDVKTAQNEDFKYLVDEFADLKIMRYQVPGWDELSLQQKKYVYHLAEAASMDATSSGCRTASTTSTSAG